MDYKLDTCIFCYIDKKFNNPTENEVYICGHCVADFVENSDGFRVDSAITSLTANNYQICDFCETKTVFAASIHICETCCERYMNTAALKKEDDEKEEDE